MGAGDFDVVSRYGPGDGSTPLLFLFTGEGSHSAQTDVPSLKLSPSWPAVEAALERNGLPDLESLLATILGSHGAPLSPVVTTVITTVINVLVTIYGLNYTNVRRDKDANNKEKFRILHFFLRNPVRATCCLGPICR